MLLTELVDALDSTIAECQRSRPRRRTVVFRVHSTSPHLLGESGWRLPDDPQDPRPQYGFTLRQVCRMRQTLEDTLLEEAGLVGQPLP